MAKLSTQAKMTAQFVLGVIVVFAGLVLIFSAFFMPPAGDINGNILVAYGESLTFAGALIGVDYHYRVKTYRHEDDEEK